MSDLTTIANRIKLARKNLGITKRELAERMGLHETSIAKYELGGVDFPVSRIRDLAEVLGVTESWLLGLGVFQCKGELDFMLDELIDVLDSDTTFKYKGTMIGVYNQTFLLDILKRVIGKVEDRQKLLEFASKACKIGFEVREDEADVAKAKAKKDVACMFAKEEFKINCEE